MGYIARLPEAVFNSLRSSTLLTDFAQIVEELVSNSIDAGSTKVDVSVDVETRYIKVEDDGCGIKREDLTLLGERHATSKLHTLAELNAGIRTLGTKEELPFAKLNLSICALFCLESFISNMINVSKCK